MTATGPTRRSTRTGANRRAARAVVEAQQQRVAAVGDEGRRHRRARHHALEVARGRAGAASPACAAMADVPAAAAVRVLDSQPSGSAGASMRTGGCAMPQRVEPPKKLLRIAHAAHGFCRRADQRQQRRAGLEQVGLAPRSRCRRSSRSRRRRVASARAAPEHAPASMRRPPARRSSQRDSRARVSTSPKQSSATTAVAVVRRRLGEHARRDGGDGQHGHRQVAAGGSAAFSARNSRAAANASGKLSADRPSRHSRICTSSRCWVWYLTLPMASAPMPTAPRAGQRLARRPSRRHRRCLRAAPRSRRPRP